MTDFVGVLAGLDEVGLPLDLVEALVLGVPSSGSSPKPNLIIVLLPSGYM